MTVSATLKGKPQTSKHGHVENWDLSGEDAELIAIAAKINPRHDDREYHMYITLGEEGSGKAVLKFADYPAEDAQEELLADDRQHGIALGRMRQELKSLGITIDGISKSK